MCTSVSCRALVCCFCACPLFEAVSAHLSAPLAAVAVMLFVLSGSCQVETVVECVCGKSSAKKRCGEEYSCNIRCNRLKTCGRHNCGHRCCLGSRSDAEALVAASRHALEKKTLSSAERQHHEALVHSIQSCQSCNKECGRQLNCGNHRCLAR